MVQEFNKVPASNFSFIRSFRGPCPEMQHLQITYDKQQLFPAVSQSSKLAARGFSLRLFTYPLCLMTYTFFRLLTLRPLDFLLQIMLIGRADRDFFVADLQMRLCDRLYFFAIHDEASMNP